MSPFEQELSRNSDSGAAYILGREGAADFEDYDMADATAHLQRMGHEVVQSVFERQVVDLDAATVVRRGIVKVLPALNRQELGVISQETGFSISPRPVLH